MGPRFWLRPVFFVALRDIKITLRYKSWVAALLVWPVLFPLTFYFMGKGLAGTTGQGLGHFERLAQTGDFASFLILGNLVWLFIFLTAALFFPIGGAWLFNHIDRKCRIQGSLHVH